MQPPINQLYKFGQFCLDVGERVLIRDGRIAPLSPKVFDTLLVLIENRGRILGKDELMQKSGGRSAMANTLKRFPARLSICLRGATCQA